MSFEGFPKETFTFLENLAANNEKPWFDEHRADYEAHWLAPAVAFVDALGDRLFEIAENIEVEPRVNGSIFRINRDVRFAKGGGPYKTHLGIRFRQPGRPENGPVFYVHVEPGKVLVAAGSYMLSKDGIAVYREAVAADGSGGKLAKAVAEVETAGYRLGSPDALKRVPAPYDRDHPRGELLKRKGLVAVHEGPLPPEVHSAAFVDWSFAHLKKMLPVYRWCEANLVTAPPHLAIPE